MAYLTLITGPMFSGKTTALLQAAQAYEPRQVVLIKPALDTRYVRSSIVSHDGVQLPAVVVDHTKPELQSRLSSTTTMVCIDELNFFAESILSELEEIRAQGISITASGLSYDFAKQPFGPALALAKIADRVVELTARCDGCGGNAIHSYRKVQLPTYIAVGASEIYGACCDDCFSSLSKAS